MSSGARLTAATCGRVLEWACAEQPMEGHTVSGDTCRVFGADEGVLLAVIDGLGHGEAAHAAAQGVVAALGEDHPGTLATMSNLGDTLRAQGDFDGAQTLQHRAMEGLRRTLGEDNPHTLTVMDNLATTLRARGDLATSRRLHESVLARRRRTLGEDHPDVLTSLNNVAESLRDLAHQPIVHVGRILADGVQYWPWDLPHRGAFPGHGRGDVRCFVEHHALAQNGARPGKADLNAASHCSSVA